MAKQRTIVLVDKINIATQWQDRIETALGYKAGIIGDSIWDEQDITVATRQTLWRKRNLLDLHNWWAGWGAVISDESHGISAETLQHVVQRFPAWYRIGLSATPDRREWLQSVSRSILGEIFCKTTDDDLERSGRLIRPKVVVYRTPFRFRWNKRASQQREWQRMVKRLKFDPARNRLIGRIMGDQRGHSCLVSTDHTGHAHELAGYALANGWPNDRVHMLTGQQNKDERREIIKFAMEGDTIIFSTIGEEALDIPRLDRLFMVFPKRLEYSIVQVTGRLKRPNSEKDYPVVFDFWDREVEKLHRQFLYRRGVYDRDRLEVRFI